MRAWRKLHGSLASSERLARVSYEARWLFTLFDLAQDDSGSYPWTPTMIRSLIPTTDWDIETATKYRDELAAEGIVTVDGDVVTLRKGKDLNGNPKPDREPWYYPNSNPSLTEVRPEADTSPTDGGHESDLSRVKSRVEYSRVEQSRVEAAATDDTEDFAIVVRAYEDLAGLIAKTVAEEITERLEDGVPVEWFLEAFSRSAAQNKRNWAYARSILKRWKEQGYMDTGKKEAKEAKDPRFFDKSKYEPGGKYEHLVKT